MHVPCRRDSGHVPFLTSYIQLFFSKISLPFMVCFLEIEFCVHNLGLWIPLQEPGVKAPCSVSHLNLLVDTGLAHATFSWTQEEESHMAVLRRRPGGTHLSSVLSTWPCCRGRRAEGFGSLFRPCTVKFVTSLGARIPGWLNARGWAWPSLAVSLRTGMPREQIRSSDQRLVWSFLLHVYGRPEGMCLFLPVECLCLVL